MEEALKYIAGISTIGFVGLFVWFLKIKKTLKEELVDPVVDPLKNDIEALKKDVASLQLNDKDLADKLEAQFNSVKESLATTNQSIAKMQGSLDIIVKRLEK